MPSAVATPATTIARMAGEYERGLGMRTNGVMLQYDHGRDRMSCLCPKVSLGRVYVEEIGGGALPV
jgi:hypothetical protein